MGLLDSKDSRREAHLAVALVGALAAIWFTGWDVIVHASHFDIQGFGVGFGALLGGAGAAAAGQGWQRKTEGTNA